MNNIIETKNLTRIFTMGGQEIRAVDNIDFFLEKGDFVAIMGPSGSGKSTFLNLLGGIDRPSGGRIIFEGQDISKLSERKLDDLRLYKIGFVFQSFNLIPVLTALENVMFPLEMAKVPPKKARQRAGEILNFIGLGKRLSHNPSELSGGECQRVSLARALANNPSVIFADEPTGNLDSKTGMEIIKLMRELNQREGKTFLIVTHDGRITQLCQRVIHLEDGRII